MVYGYFFITLVLISFNLLIHLFLTKQNFREYFLPKNEYLKLSKEDRYISLTFDYTTELKFIFFVKDDFPLIVNVLNDGAVFSSEEKYLTTYQEKIPISGLKQKENNLEIFFVEDRTVRIKLNKEYLTFKKQTFESDFNALKFQSLDIKEIHIKIMN